MSSPSETVSLDPIQTYCLPATGGPETYPSTFQNLEEIVPLKGHKFYGVYTPADESYRACVRPNDGDDTNAWQLDEFLIPGGLYAYRKITGEHDELARQIPNVFDEMAAANDVDAERPSIEFYRRFDEFRLYLPVRSRK